MIFLTIIVIIISIILWKFRNYRPFVWDTNNGKYWAVVTGATDGIGYEFARQLAQKGYNIVMISRNPEKLAAKRQTILNESGNNVQIETVAVDFKKLDIYDQIRLAIKDKDVFILVNNVGFANMEKLDFFYNESSDYHQDMISVNITSTVRMTDLILPTMIEKQRGLILNLSSNLAEHSCGLGTMYSSTKAFVLNFSQTLYYECLPKNVLVFALTPMFVHSQLIAIRPSLFIPSAKCYVQNALKSIQWNEKFSCGYIYHRLLSEFTKIAALILGERYFIAVSKDIFQYHFQAYHDENFAEKSNFIKLIGTALWKNFRNNNEQII